MNKSKKWLIPVIVAVLAIGAVVVLMATGVIESGTVKVPDITNISMEEAQKILEEAGLSICVNDRIIDDSVPENTVITQSPASGEKIKEGSIVNVDISEKSVEVSVPDVKYYDKALAVEKLQAVGFRVEITEEESDKFADGAVISQSLSGKGKTGSTVELTVCRNDIAKGGEMFDIPSVIGKTPADADEALSGRFYLKIVEEKFSSKVKKGTIAFQTPSDGIECQQYTTLEAVISLGKPGDTQVIMPDVVRSSRAAAIKTLESLGLRVSVKEKYNDVVSAGIVISQSIEKGEKITADTVVTIVVSGGKQPEITTIRPGDMPTQLATSTKPEKTTKNDSQNVTQKPTTKPAVPTTKPVDLSGEKKFIADFAIKTDKAEAKAGDIITVSVKLKTNYDIVAISLPVIYDANAFELVGTSENNLASYLNFTGTLKDNGYATNGNWKSPDAMYTKNSDNDYWTSKLTKARYKIAFATWVAAPSQGTVVTTLDKEETIVTFKLKVKETASETSGRIFLSQDFIKTASTPQGILSVGRTTSDKITTDSIISTGQTIDLRDATALVVIK